MGTNANQIGIAILLFGSLTNSETDLSQWSPEQALEVTESNPVFTLAPPPGTGGLALPSESDRVSLPDEEQAIMEFASKLLGSSKDLEPEIGKIIEKRFLDML